MGRRPTRQRIRSRRYCFTVNNYTAVDVEELRQLGGDSRTKYLVFGREGDGEGETPHLQGFVIFTAQRAFSSVRKLCGGRGHWEETRASSIQAADYCKKEEDFEEFGTGPVAPGTRTDLEEIRGKIEAGVGEREIAQGHFSKWVIYRRSFSAYRAIYQGNQHRQDLEVHVLIGHTGAGKTRFVHQAAREHGEELWTSCSPDFQWFDGYSGQEWVLFDDFRGGCPFALLLRLLDVYPLSVPVKGGFVPWNPRKIYITSNLSVPEWYPDIDVAPLQRRIHKNISISGCEIEEDWEIMFMKLFERFGY